MDPTGEETKRTSKKADNVRSNSWNLFCEILLFLCLQWLWDKARSFCCQLWKAKYVLILQLFFYNKSLWWLLFKERNTCSLCSLRVLLIVCVCVCVCGDGVSLYWWERESRKIGRVLKGWWTRGLFISHRSITIITLILAQRELVYVFVWVCVHVCSRVCERETEKEKETRGKLRTTISFRQYLLTHLQ